MVVIVRKLDLQMPVQSMHITISAVSSNTAHGVMYSIQHYVIQLVSDFRQVGCFLRVLWFPPAIQLTVTTSLKDC